MLDSVLYWVYGEVMFNATTYTSQAARDAQASSFGDKSDWDYLETSAIELHAYYTSIGSTWTADLMLTRTLSQALMGNDGD